MAWSGQAALALACRLERGARHRRSVLPAGAFGTEGHASVLDAPVLRGALGLARTHASEIAALGLSDGDPSRLGR